MTDPRRMRATRLLALRALRERITAAENYERAQAKLHEFDVPGVREIGVVGDGQIGSVSLNKPAVSWRVTDPAALLAWVKGHAPGEVETVERVRSSYEGALLMQAKKQGAPVTNDGEVIPGIEATTGDPSLNVKVSDDAGEVIAQALFDGVLSWEHLMPAIEQVP